jgi:hypothetical protein
MAATTTPFEAKVLRGMRAEGLQVRRILRIYPPYDLGDPIEVLFISTGRIAGTVYVDGRGDLLNGPVPGFGPPETP